MARFAKSNMKKLLVSLFAFIILFTGSHAFASDNVSITLESNPQGSSIIGSNSSSVIINLGDTITFTGFPNNLTGQIMTDYTRSFNFDPLFDGVCLQNGSNEWSQNCTPTRAGVGTFYIQVTQNGQEYNSNLIRVLVKSNNSTTALSSTPTSDLTPRISYWYGKVNQHVDVNNGVWVTDSDGTSGADLDKLTYCKKYYPNTISVEDYSTETLNSWYTAGNSVNYTSTKPSYKCVQVTTAVPLITVTSSNESTTVSDIAEKGVLRFNIKAENSDLNINSFKINFENQNKGLSSSRLSDYITEVNSLERTCYTIWMTKKQIDPAITNKPTKFYYEGNIYCCEVPNGLIYVRNKNKCFWIR